MDSDEGTGNEGNVEKILDMRKVKKKIQFLVRWGEKEKIKDENGQWVHIPDSWVNYSDMTATHTICEYFEDPEKYKIFKACYPKSKIVKKIEEYYANPTEDIEIESGNSSDSPQLITHNSSDEVEKSVDSDPHKSDDSPKMIESSTNNDKKQKSNLPDKKTKNITKQSKEPNIVSTSTTNSTDFEKVPEIPKKDSKIKEIKLPPPPKHEEKPQVSATVSKNQQMRKKVYLGNQTYNKSTKSRRHDSDTTLLEISCSPDENYNYEIDDAKITDPNDTTIYQVRKVTDIFSDSDGLWAFLEVADDPEPKKVKFSYARYLWPDHVINYLIDQFIGNSKNDFTPDSNYNKKDDLDLLLEKELAKE